MRWYPPQEDTGVAAIATTFSNQATAELEDMKRYPVMTWFATWECSGHSGGGARIAPVCTGAGAGSGSTRFRRKSGRLWCRDRGQVQQCSGEGSGEGLGGFGAKPSQVQRVLEKVAEKVMEKVLGIFGAGPGQVPTGSTGFPPLGFAARFRKICKNKTLRLLGIPPKLFFGGFCESYFLWVI